MKFIIALIGLLLAVACTPAQQDTQQSTPEVTEPSTSMPVPGTDTEETVVEVVESSDAYEDLNTADDSFDAIDDALDALE